MINKKKDLSYETLFTHFNDISVFFSTLGSE